MFLFDAPQCAGDSSLAHCWFRWNWFFQQAVKPRLMFNAFGTK
jgi:hypothetical protein